MLADLVSRACAAKPGDAAVVAAIDAIPIPPWPAARGVDQALQARDRNALYKVGTRCGAIVKDVDPL